MTDATVSLELLERVASQRRFHTDTLEIAKRLMVYGEKPARLTAEFGVNHQRVYAIRRLVLAAIKALDLPEDWEQVTLAGPRPLIAALKAQHAEALQQLEEGRSPGRGERHDGRPGKSAAADTQASD